MHPKLVQSQSRVCKVARALALSYQLQEAILPCTARAVVVFIFGHLKNLYLVADPLPATATHTATQLATDMICLIALVDSHQTKCQKSMEHTPSSD